MAFFHVVSALILIALVLVVLVQIATANRGALDEQLPALGVLGALLLAVVLFTGFLQLGSQNTVPSSVLYKLGATAAGGVLALFGIFYRVRGGLSRLLFALTQGGALVLFLASLYWAMGL